MRFGRAAMLATTIIAGVPALAALGLVLAPSAASAQDYTTAALTGTVANDAGAPVAGATVSVVSSQGGRRTATTAANGTFTIPALAFGNYSATVTAPGFSPTKNDINVSPNNANYSFTLTPSSNTVVVTGRVTRKEDFSKTETGLTVNVQQLANRVPVGRSITSIVQLAPTVSLPDASINASARRNQTLSSVAGGSAGETVYYINGLNVTDQRTFLGFADLPFDAVQTVDIKTGGYAAEFGRATGGVVTTTTRSGSNDFHFGGSAFYTPDRLRNDSPNAFGAAGAGTFGSRTYNDVTRSSTVDTDVYLSGPIIKDHLFFFGIVNPRNTYTTGAGSIPIATPASGNATDANLNPTTGGSITKSHTDSPRWLTKVDLNITDKQRIEATIFSDAQKTVFTTSAYDRINGAGALSSSLSEKAGGTNQIYKYTGVFTDWFTLSAQYGQVRSQYTDSSPQGAIPRVRDLTTSGVINYLTSARTAFSIDSSAEDIRESARVDADFYFSLFGKHHVRGGYDREGLRSDDSSNLNGGAAYDFLIAGRTGLLSGSSATRAAPGTLYVRQLVFSSGGTFKAEQDAYYLQDSWQPFPRLTLELGVRNDTYDYKTGAGADFINLDSQYAPRVGFTYDVFGNGQDKLYGSFGRYYLPIAENTAIREASANPYYYRYYNVASKTLNAQGLPALGTVITPDVIFGSATAPDYRTIAASNIKPQYKDEFILGYEHQFRDLTLFGNDSFHNLRVGIAYSDLTLQSTIEDTDLGYAVDSYCANNKIASCSGNNAGLYQGSYTLLNPGKDARVFLDLTNGPGTGQGQYYTLTRADLGLPSAVNHYQALQFTFERPFDGKWSLQGSYVLSKSHGNYEGGVDSDIGQTDTSITQDFDNRYFTIGQKGDLPNDHRHTIKLFGSYSPVEPLSLGLNFVAQSGRKFSCLGYDLDDPNYSPSPSQRFCPLGTGGMIVETPRGTLFQTDWVTQVDFNLTYRLQVNPRFGTPVLRVDAFNIFNEQESTRVVEQGPVSGMPNTLSATYLLPRSYQTPRYVRFGLQYAF